MASDVVLKVSNREVLGKSVRGLRISGFIPAVLYAAGRPGISIQLPDKNLKDLLKKHSVENLILRLELEGVKGKASALAMIRDVQRDPIRDVIIHVDFQEVSLKKKIRTHVHIEAVDEAAGVKEQGGILEHLLREIEIECLPTDIPEGIHYDVSHLRIGESATVGDLKLPEDITVLTPTDWSIFTVAAPKLEEEPKPEEEGEGFQEPEVISKGKEEEEKPEEGEKEAAKKEEG